MRGILYAQLKLLVRNPATFLLMTGICILFAIFLGNTGSNTGYVPVYSEMGEEKTEQVIEYLQETDTQSFEQNEKAEVVRAVREGDAIAGLYLYDDHYELLVATKAPTFPILEQNVQKAFGRYLQEERLLESDKINAHEVINQLEEPMFIVETKTFFGEDSFVYDPQLQVIFGFAVFFVIYTIAFNVLQITVAREQGIWDRFILSPVKKWEMYLGILSYAFVLGYIQVVIVFSVFKYGFGVDFHGGFGEALVVLIPYVLSIVSLSVFIVGVSKNIQTFQGLISLLAVSLAMIGGSYWPIEIVSNKILLALSKIDPITYIMEGLKSVTVYGQSLTEVMYPVSILLLMSVIMIGLGINIMERRE
ncbi:ABC transporter permease [Salinibacillus xinjiangensis]|uniref:ABC transporter permease n=1 Tax=Salinibacillus xinjiangensis TaxID=1229268 RepID=A0A6G1X9C5_9BACI|nr:ABC transporter permease [Salinibacillus xinjiangensis]MRG87505.1 ABC transporter permease [Salinibacillus xinjiangensis]